MMVIFPLLVVGLLVTSLYGWDAVQREKPVATVGDAQITAAEFDEGIRRGLGVIQQQMEQAGLRERFDPTAFDNEEFRRNILDQLIEQKANELMSKERLVTTSDSQLRQFLSSIPSIANPDGSVNVDLYKEQLARMGKTPAAFEAEMRTRIAAEFLPRIISVSTVPSSFSKERIFDAIEQVRAVKTQTILASEFAQRVSPTDEQLKAYYDKNQDQYRVPESAKIEYVVLGPDAVANQVVLNADDVKTYYEQNKARYAAPDQRRVSHIFFDSPKTQSAADRKKARDAAAAVLAELKKDPSKFAELAKSKSQDTGSASNGGDLGFNSKEGLGDQFANAVFSLAKDTLSEVIETDDGFHIAKVTDIRTGEVRSFESVKADIENELKRNQVNKVFNEAANQFKELVFSQGDSFKAVAEKFKLTIQTAQGVSRSSPQPGAGPVLSDTRFLKEIFSDESIREKKNTAAFELASKEVVSARILEYTPPSIRPLAEVKALVTQRVKNEEGLKQAATAGQAKLKELQGGGAASGFADGTVEVSRINPGPLSQKALEAIFRASTDKLPTFVGVEEPNGYSIYQIVAVKAGDSPEKNQMRQQLAGRFDIQQANQETAAYVASIRAKYKVVKYEDRILKGITTPASGPTSAPVSNSSPAPKK